MLHYIVFSAQKSLCQKNFLVKNYLASKIAMKYYGT